MEKFNLWFMEKVSDMPYGRIVEGTATAYFGDIKVIANQFSIKIGKLEIPNTREAMKALMVVSQTNNRIKVSKFDDKEEIYRYEHPYMGLRIGCARTEWNDNITNPQKVCTLSEESASYDFRRFIDSFQTYINGTDLNKELIEISDNAQ